MTGAEFVQWLIDMNALDLTIVITTTHNEHNVDDDDFDKSVRTDHGVSVVELYTTR